METNKPESMAVEPAVTAPEPPRKAPKKPQDAPVRRVGSFTLGACLIAAGIFFLCYYFLPNFNWELALKIAPAAGLCLLGCEVLYFASHPGRWKYDFLSVLFCLILMTGCFFMSFLPILRDRFGAEAFGPEADARQTRLATEYENALYGDIRYDTDIPLKDLTVTLRNYYGRADTLAEAADDLNAHLGVLHVNLELEGPYDQKATFAIDCRKLTDILQKQTVQPGVVTFYYDGAELVEDSLNSGSMKQTCSYTLTLNDVVQLDWTADQMCKATEESSLLDEENADSTSASEEAE